MNVNRSMCLDEIQIIFQDVDGCLNPEDGEAFGATEDWTPSVSQIAMLERLNRAIESSPVSHFIINTGRFWPILSQVAEHLTTRKARYFLLEHACVIYDRERDGYLDLVAVARQCEMGTLVERFGNLRLMQRLLDWYDRVGQAGMEAVYGGLMPRLDKVGNLSYALPEAADPDEVLARIESMIRADFSAVECASLEFCRSDRFIDILPGIHKLDGIELMCAYLGVDPGHALAVGDYLNDLAVFEAFPRVMCPANAHPKIIDLTRSKGPSGIVSDKAYGAALLELLERMRA
ncbi:HAD hydrolase family protein [Coraliomargarita parva]|uniref:HAD hydrolase family protein n=1 Tax=Coraliomargarita parva TaxID=3014050 RepID=UPI0022B5943E|nr:HAD hydrolase family protein [Coraliomargarita parva]